MTARPGISLYNQDRLSDDNFVDNFVARQDLLERLLNGLHHQAKGGETEHQILIGARGMGKTSLLRRVAIAIMADDELRTHFIPLKFREEQYNVIALDAFWRNCGEALAEWCDANGHPAEAGQLDQAVDSSAWRDAATAASAFLDACRRLGGRPILLLDNIDLILEALSDQESWLLRAVLQRADGPIVIGAATQFLAQGGRREAPFFEFFHVHVLEPLTEAELLRCMHALADLRREAGQPVKAILAREPERLRTLYALTGGNPRILALIYQLLERAESDTIFADLEALLDQVTPFYKARIEEYQTSQQRAVIDAIALHWDPITSGAIAEATGIEVTTISSQLNRLRKDGLIEDVPTSGARSGYQLGERFLNIWYLMRHGTRRTKQRLRWLTLFLVKLFSATELQAMAAQARGDEERCAWHPDFRTAVLEAHESLALSALPTQQAPNGSGTGHDIYAVDGQPATGNRGDNGLERDHTIDDRSADARAEMKSLLDQAWRAWESGRLPEAVAVYDEVVARFGAAEEAGLREQVARALVNKGATLGGLGRLPEAVAVNDEVVARFGAAEEAGLRELVARALVSKGVTLRALGRSAEAVAAYDAVIARFGAAEKAGLREQVARALVSKGVALGALGRSAEEIAVYDEVVARFGNAEAAGLREPVARALFNKGRWLFDAFHDTAGAEAAYRRALKFDDESLSLKANLAWVLIATGRIDEAAALHAELAGLPDEGRALLEAGIDLARDNFGLATERLDHVLSGGLEPGASAFFEDLLWLLRQAEAGGYGERLLAWLEATGHAERYAPVHGAFVAYLRGERFLLDLNPETRDAARQIFDRLSAPRRPRHQTEELGQKRARKGPGGKTKTSRR